ncbi:hypothetical protein ACS0TY_028478 [Phlomoides rotata]
MIISKESDLKRQESSTSTHDHTAPKTTSSSSSWSRLKDPRIVRVSRAFGGKDRHSKVCTVKGLRDRRVRLSVPTAIQLYDLQDRLGLNQPSKVVDWLLHAAKHEIDELPPLHFPPGAFPVVDAKYALKLDANINWSNGKYKEVVAHDQDWVSHHQDFSNQDWGNQNSFARWDPSSNLTLSHPLPHPHPRSNGLSPHQHDDWPNFNLMAPTMVFQHGMGSTQSYFPNSQIGEIEAKYNNNNQGGATTSPTGDSSRRQMHFSMMTANLLPSQSDDAS